MAHHSTILSDIAFSLSPLRPRASRSRSSVRLPTWPDQHFAGDSKPLMQTVDHWDLPTDPIADREFAEKKYFAPCNVGDQISNNAQGAGALRLET
jgi:hypothetical protein